MTPTVEQAVNEAESWLGTVEQPAGSNKVPGVTDWYGLVGPWCAMWISRVFWDAGLPLPASTSKGFAYTPSGAAWFKQQGRWKTSNPKRGDVVFFDFPGDGVNRISHVGIVTGVRPDGSIETIEGNTDERGGRTGGKVMRKVRSVGIVGYGTPAYVKPPTEVRPMYDPPLPVASVWQDESGRVLAGVGPDGGVFAWGVPYRGGPNGKPYWGNRRAGAIRPNPRHGENPGVYPHYIVVATDGAEYGHTGF